MGFSGSHNLLVPRSRNILDPPWFWDKILNSSFQTAGVAQQSGHPPAANRAPSQEPAPPPYKWVTRALLETVERAASLRIERAKKLAISANWGVAPMVGQDDERVEEVFEVAEVAVQVRRQSLLRHQ